MTAPSLRLAPSLSLAPADDLSDLGVVPSRVIVSTAVVALNSLTHSGGQYLIRNTDGVNGVDLGPATVSAGTGFPLAPSATVAVTLTAGELLYATRSTGVDVVVAVLRT